MYVRFLKIVFFCLLIPLSTSCVIYRDTDITVPWQEAFALGEHATAILLRHQDPTLENSCGEWALPVALQMDEQASAKLLLADSRVQSKLENCLRMQTCVRSQALLNLANCP